MKPIIINANKDGKVEFTKEELEKLISNAYQEGFTDGSKTAPAIPYPVYPTYPYNPWNSPTYTVTCNAGNTQQIIEKLKDIRCDSNLKSTYGV